MKRLALLLLLLNICKVGFSQKKILFALMEHSEIKYPEYFLTRLFQINDFEEFTNNNCVVKMDSLSKQIKLRDVIKTFDRIGAIQVFDWTNYSCCDSLTKLKGVISIKELLSSNRIFSDSLIIFDNNGNKYKFYFFILSYDYCISDLKLNKYTIKQAENYSIVCGDLKIFEERKELFKIKNCFYLQLFNNCK